MRESELDRVSRSFAGHLITNPALRKAVHDAYRTAGRSTPEARVAKIINKTIAPKTPVKEADVPKIRKRMNALVAKTPPVRAFETTNEFNWEDGE
jgi:hypothetical protein